MLSPKKISSGALLLILLIFHASSSGSENKTGAVVAGITIPVGVIGAGAATFFIIRNVIRDRNHGDSIIALVEGAYDSSIHFFSVDSYRAASVCFGKMVQNWQEYEKYRNKRKMESRFRLDSLENAIVSCDFLYGISGRIDKMRATTDSLPRSEDVLVSQSRHELLYVMKRCRDEIDSITEKNRHLSQTVSHGFRRSLVKLEDLDTMFSRVYEQEKVNFTYKSKFFYNRAVDSKDSVVLKRFVDDCDYYQVEKEWCARARLAANSTPVKADSVVEKKFTFIDTMQTEYNQAVASGRIEPLEQYIKKYSVRRFRKMDTKIDSARIIASALKRDLDEEASLEKAHPLFANASMEDLGLTIKGLPQAAGERFRGVFESAKADLKNVSGIRFPASVTIDYSSRPPILFLNAYINCKRDVERKTSQEGDTYYAGAVPEVMGFLNKIKKTVVNDLEKDGAQNTKEARNLRTAAYVVRLRKNVDEYITLYGKENMGARQGSEEFKFYDFFDITLKDKRDARLTNGPTHIIELQPTAASDSLKAVLTTRFFEK